MREPLVCLKHGIFMQQLSCPLCTSPTKDVLHLSTQEAQTSILMVTLLQQWMITTSAWLLALLPSNLSFQEKDIQIYHVNKLCSSTGEVMSEARYLRKQTNKQGSEHLIQVIQCLSGMLRFYLYIFLFPFSAEKTMVLFP